MVNLQVSGQARRAGREAWHRRGGWTVTSVQMPPLQTGAAPRGSAAGPRPLLGSRAGWGREEPQSPADDSRFLPPSLLSLVSLQGRRWPQHTAPVGGEQLAPSTPTAPSPGPGRAPGHGACAPLRHSSPVSSCPVPTGGPQTCRPGPTARASLRLLSQARWKGAKEKDPCAPPCEAAALRAPHAAPIGSEVPKSNTPSAASLAKPPRHTPATPALPGRLLTGPATLPARRRALTSGLGGKAPVTSQGPRCPPSAERASRASCDLLAAFTAGTLQSEREPRLATLHTLLPHLD